MAGVLDALLESDRWDPAKHPRGVAGRFVELTESGIRAAALRHNSGYPESESEIREGRPVVRVNVSAQSRRSSSGWYASITPGVVAKDGGVWAAQDPVRVPLRRFDGRLSGVDHAKRATKHLGLSGAKVPIEYNARGLA